VPLGPNAGFQCRPLPPCRATAVHFEPNSCRRPSKNQMRGRLSSRTQRLCGWTLLLFVCVTSSGVALGQSTSTYLDLHDFGGEVVNENGLKGPDGGKPTGGVAFDRFGNMFGTTSGGGQHGCGTVWEVTTSGVYRDLHDFGELSSTPTVPAAQTAATRTQVSRSTARETCTEQPPMAVPSRLSQRTETFRGRWAWCGRSRPRESIETCTTSLGQRLVRAHLLIT